jgi:hypothetical protein
MADRRLGRSVRTARRHNVGLFSEIGQRDEIQQVSAFSFDSQSLARHVSHYSARSEAVKDNWDTDEAFGATG